MLSFTEHLLLSSCYELDTVLSTRDLAVNKKISALETLNSTSKESLRDRLRGLSVMNWGKYGCPHRCEEV